MKTLSAFIVAVIICIGCRDIPARKQGYHINTPRVSIKIDTIELDIKGQLQSIVKSAGNYYLLFIKYNYMSNNELNIVIADSNFTNKRKLKAPEYFTHNILLHVHEDSIIANDTFNKTMFLFNRDNETWDAINWHTLPVYEDNDYRVITSVSGEFGGTVFFTDNNTRSRYEGLTNANTIINRLNEKYYITFFMPHENSGSCVLEIPDPRKMLLSDTSRNEQSYSMNETNSKQGMNMLFYLDNPVPVASFVHKNKLLHMCSHDDSTCIAEYENNQLHKILALGIHIYPEIQQQIANEYQLYCFFTVDSFELFGREHDGNPTEELCGFIEIVPNEIYIHFIKTNNPPNPFYHEL